MDILDTARDHLIINDSPSMNINIINGNKGIKTSFVLVNYFAKARDRINSVAKFSLGNKVFICFKLLNSIPSYQLDTTIIIKN